MTRFPRHLEAQYLRRLRRRLTTARNLIRERIPELRRDAPSFIDAERIRRLIRAVQDAWQVVFPVEPESLEPIATGVDTFGTGQTTRAVQRVIGIDVSRAGDLTAMHLEWARKNVELIKTMESRFFDSLAEEVVRAVTEGRTDLVQILTQRYGVAISDAKRIARTEVAKLNAQITEYRQREFGIERYEWQTAEDERVRPSHRALNGTIHSWDNPPSEGHPGTSINCRCVALPVFDDDDDE